MTPATLPQLFLDSNVLTGGIVSPWGLDKAVLSLCAARICRMLLAEIVREEVEDNLLRHAAALDPQEAAQVLDDYTNLIKLARSSYHCRMQTMWSAHAGTESDCTGAPSRSETPLESHLEDGNTSS